MKRETAYGRAATGKPKPKLAVEGPGGVQASFDFPRRENDVADRRLTVTLTNDLDGVVYA